MTVTRSSPMLWQATSVAPVPATVSVPPTALSALPVVPGPRKPLVYLEEDDVDSDDEDDDDIDV